jgi:enolase
MKLTIRRLRALEILDSRGNPTLSVEAELSDGATGEAKVPSGASTGRHEAVELRDNDPHRYHGKGVRKAAANVEEFLARHLEGFDAEDQPGLDRQMIVLDGTPDKSHVGANAILGVSCAVACAVARSRRIALWEYLSGKRIPAMPIPLINILSGGLHAGHNFEFQDFQIIPHGFSEYSHALEASVCVHRAAREVLESRGCLLTGLADEGGWGPRLENNEMALDVLMRTIERAGFHPGEQISIAVDVASTHFFRDGAYDLTSEHRLLSADQMIELLTGWCDKYPIVAIEDALAEDEWEGWQLLTRTLGERIQLIGDDLFTTNPSRVERGIREGAANAVLVKMNQIGTLTETFRVIDMARDAGFRAVISARSGETESSLLADLAVASGAGLIKIGSVARSERLAKYNRLLDIETRNKALARSSLQTYNQTRRMQSWISSQEVG